MIARYKNLSAKDRDKPIYRIVRIDHLYSLFARGENVLVAPEKWDDPYENLLTRLVKPGAGPSCFGQCWTFHQASDAMWRIYSPMPFNNRRMGIRIRSTARRLIDSLNPACKPTDSGCVGKVRYMREKGLVDSVRSRARGNADGWINTLLLKRIAFRHEREVRLLLVSTQRPRDELLRYRVDPHEMIDQIMLDPRLPKDDADSWKAQIKRKTLFKGAIKRSLLYAPPDIN